MKIGENIKKFSIDEYSSSRDTSTEKDEYITYEEGTAVSDKPINSKLAGQISYHISLLQSYRNDITNNHSDWIKIGFAFASLGNGGRIYYHNVCRLYPNYDYKECEVKFSELLNKYDGQISINTFFKYCKEIVIRNVIKKANSNLQKVMELGVMDICGGIF